VSRRRVLGRSRRTLTYAPWRSRSSRSTACGPASRPRRARRTPRPAKRFKQVAGGFNVPRDDGSENYSDATQFPDTQDWVNTLVGNGNPGITGTPEELAWLFWALEGGETTSAVTGPPAKTKHTDRAAARPRPLDDVGDAQGSSEVDRFSHNDCQISQAGRGLDRANKACARRRPCSRSTPASRSPPTRPQAMPTKATFLYTDGTGRFTSTAHVPRPLAFTLTINKDLQPVYADDVTVYDLAIGNAPITIGVTLYFDTDGRAQFNKLVYGNAAPAPGTKPAKYITGSGPTGSTCAPATTAGAANGDKFVLTLAGVKWAIPTRRPEPGRRRRRDHARRRDAQVAGNPALQIDIDNDAAAFTV
jgi:hypothetical protein